MKDERGSLSFNPSSFNPSSFILHLHPSSFILNSWYYAPCLTRLLFFDRRLTIHVRFPADSACPHVSSWTRPTATSTPRTATDANTCRNNNGQPAVRTRWARASSTVAFTISGRITCSYET